MTISRTHRSLTPLAVAAALITALSPPTTAQFDDVVIETQEVTSGIYMLRGRGGNLGLSVGSDATFLIDDQFAPLTDKITAAIADITNRPVDYLLNTHWHSDHSGGNENFGKAGALIIAHDNVRTRMDAGVSSGVTATEPAPPAALPVVTFNDSLTLHINGHTIKGTHVHHAHTDGDTIVLFVEANVMHMGDTFFNGRYPFIDVDSGGTIDGIIDAAAHGLELSDGDTAIIPGHGALAKRADLQYYHDMLVTVRERIAALAARGMTLEQVIAEEPTADFNAYANRAGSSGPERFIGAVYASFSE